MTCCAHIPGYGGAQPDYALAKTGRAPSEASHGVNNGKILPYRTFIEINPEASHTKCVNALASLEVHAITPWDTMMGGLEYACKAFHCQG